MRNIRLGLAALLIFTLSFVLTACGGNNKAKLTTQTIASDDGVNVSLSYPEDAGYTWSINQDDFRTSKNKAILIAPDFKIAVEFVDLGYFYSNDFENYKQKQKENRGEVNDVTYNNIAGFRSYHASYYANVVTLPVAGSDKTAVDILVYPFPDVEAKSDEAFNSTAVQDILKTVQIEQK